MIAPSAMYIEAALDQLKDEDYINHHLPILTEQRKQFFCAIPLGTEEGYRYYALAMEVARLILRGTPNAVKNGVSL